MSNDFPELMQMNGPINWSPGMSLAEVEKQVILRAFRHFRGSKTTTANALGISIRTLDTRLEEYQNQQKAEVERNANTERERAAFLQRQRGGVSIQQARALAIRDTGIDPHAPVPALDESAEGRVNAAVERKRAELNGSKSIDLSAGKAERQSSDNAASGVRVESVADAPAQHEMPVSQRDGVQKVLPQQTAQSGQARRR